MHIPAIAVATARVSRLWRSRSTTISPGQVLAAQLPEHAGSFAQDLGPARIALANLFEVRERICLRPQPRRQKRAFLSWLPQPHAEAALAAGFVPDQEPKERAEAVHALAPCWGRSSSHPSLAGGSGRLIVAAVSDASRRPAFEGRSSAAPMLRLHSAGRRNSIQRVALDSKEEPTPGSQQEIQNEPRLRRGRSSRRATHHVRVCYLATGSCAEHSLGNGVDQVPVPAAATAHRRAHYHR